MGKSEICFHYGALSDKLETQARKQGYTLGREADFLEKVLYGLQCGFIHSVITPSEYDKILRRFQTKMIVPKLKKVVDPTHTDTTPTDPDEYLKREV